MRRQPSPGEEVMVNRAGDCHYGDVAEVVGPFQSDGSIVRVRECVHTFRNSELFAVPGQDVPPNPVGKVG